MYAMIIEIIRAIAAWVRYRFDPEMVKRRDDLHKKFAEERSHEELDKALAGGNTITLGYFFSEYLSRVRQDTDHTPGRPSDFPFGILSKPGPREDRDSDTNPGLDDS